MSINQTQRICLSVGNAVFMSPYTFTTMARANLKTGFLLYPVLLLVHVYKKRTSCIMNNAIMAKQMKKQKKCLGCTGCRSPRMHYTNRLWIKIQIYCYNVLSLIQFTEMPDR